MPYHLKCPSHESLSRWGGLEAAPAPSHKFHREAPASPVDPETVATGNRVLLPRRKGSDQVPQPSR